MRLRHIVALVALLLLVGGGVWFFTKGTTGGSIGAGGLPLIKADINPVRLPPEEPGGDIMPNADSTVFPAISNDSTIDPSMENLKLPDQPKADTANAAEFAGLRTGFSVPAEPEKKVESLFAAPVTDATPSADAAPAPELHKNDYVSGLAPEALANPEISAATPVADAPPPETVIEPVVEPVVAPVIAPAADPAVAPETPAIDTSTAQDMEEQEKAAITGTSASAVVPPVKPPVPAAKSEKPSPVIPTSPSQALAAQAQSPAAMVQEAVQAEVEARKTAQADAAYNPVVAAPSASGYYIQLASTPAREEGPKLWARLAARYPDALSGLSPAYQTANVPGKGEYVRVQAGPMTRDQANLRCAKLHAVDPKGGCLVFRR